MKTTNFFRIFFKYAPFSTVALALFSLLVVNVSLHKPETSRDVWNYEVEIKNKIAGNVKVIREKEGRRKYKYQTHSFIKHQVIIPIKVIHDFQVTYENDLLKYAVVKIQVNGKEHTGTQTIYQGYKRWLFREGNKDEEIHKTIDYSSILLYFREPKGIDQAYSEEDGSFHTLERTAAHTYLKISPKGRKNTYYYENGMLKHAEIDTKAIDFSISLVSE